MQKKLSFEIHYNIQYGASSNRKWDGVTQIKLFHRSLILTKYFITLFLVFFKNFFKKLF